MDSGYGARGAAGASGMGGAGDRRRQIETLCLLMDGLGSGPQWGLAMERALRIPGVVRVFVSPPMETMYLAYDPAETDERLIRDALGLGEGGLPPHPRPTRREALMRRLDLE